MGIPVEDVEGHLVPVPLVPVHIHISRGYMYMCYEVIMCDLYVSKSVIYMYMAEPQHVIELLLHIGLVTTCDINSFFWYKCVLNWQFHLLC